MMPIEGEALPGYVAWLPDRQVTLYRDPACWSRERLKALGDTPAHRSLWRLLDRLADVFWRASRLGVRLPVHKVDDAIRAARVIGLGGLPLVRYLGWTVADALRAHGLQDDRPLVGLLAMLVEDTVHGSVAEAPLINAALGITIRGAGLTRARGGMRGFWRCLISHYRHLGGELRVGCPVQQVEAHQAQYRVVTRRGIVAAGQVVAAVPASLAARLGPEPVAEALAPYLRRDAAALGGAAVVFLGVAENEVAGQAFTHHQLLHDYGQPLGDGNNMFVSVSAQGDTDSPGGLPRRDDLNALRAGALGRPCARSIPGAQTRDRRAPHQAGQSNLSGARSASRGLRSRHAKDLRAVHRAARGAVGGVRQTRTNSNQRAIPHDLGVPGYWLVGDSTWPGLGTVACCLGSRLVAEGVLAAACCSTPVARPSTSRGKEPSMPSASLADTELPLLETLGEDLLATTRHQGQLALVRPFLGVAAFALAANAGLWWLTPLLVFLVFVAVVTVTHDVVHGSLGLSRGQTEWALFALGAVLLESGHAYRATHLRHHQVFPGPDDPEGDPARMTLLQAILWGPLFLPRLWYWSYARGKPGGTLRRWLVAEASWALAVPTAGCWLLPWTPAVLVYAVLVIVGSWVYPLLTVHLPHRNYGDTPLSQTHTLRGRIIPALFLELTYHLEHHLYPDVPSHNLPELSRRLDPLLRQAGVRPRRVP